MSRRFAERFAPGVRILLASVALVPFIGLAALAALNVEGTNEQAERTAAVSELAENIERRAKVQALIDAESYWGHAFSAVEDIGLPLDAINEITGLDVETSYAEAQALVDAVIQEENVSPEAIAELQEARALVRQSATNVEIEEAYDRAEGIVTERIRGEVFEIRGLTGDLEDARTLGEVVRALELSMSLRTTTAAMTEAYFASRFPVGRDVAIETRALISNRTTYEQDAAELAELVRDNPGLNAALQRTVTHSSVVAFGDRVDRFTITALVEGSDGPIFGTGLNLAQIPDEVAAFKSSQDSVAQHVELVGTISAEVTAQALAANDVATETRFWTILTTIGLLVAAMIAGYAASVWIIRPLRQMRFVVEGLAQGTDGLRVREEGPAEIRAAASALNEAVATIAITEQMATALAERDLDNPAFAAPNPGRLGASLRDAVVNLADSMSQGEIFRERLAHEASHDGLTGVANRSDAMQHLRNACERTGSSNGATAVFYIDVDGFKGVNDTYGHAAGDAVLRSVAGELEVATRDHDVVGRIGGDEFVVIAENVKDEALAQIMAERMLAGILRPTAFGSAELRVSASIGFAMASETADPHDLLRDADLALYEAKILGRNRAQFCDAGLKARQIAQSTVERDLQRALHNDELHLAFQPIVAADGHQIASMESLLRWTRPDGSSVSPAEFIPIAEKSDLILDIDRWVLSAVLARLADWSADPVLAKTTASLNLSARSLSCPGVAEHVLRRLHEYEVDPTRLTIEVTETAVLDDLGLTAASLHQLRNAGVRIAIDDFGTGYASLAHLRQLPLDILKIDQSFVANLGQSDDRSLVQLTIDTGHLLGATIVAEGVETEEQAQLLDAMGADLLQGYSFARPMPATELRQWVVDAARGNAASPKATQRPPETLTREPVT